MAVTVEELVVTLSARMDQYHFALANAQRDGDRRFAEIERRFDTFGARMKGTVSGVAASIKGTFAGIAASFGATELTGYADAWLRVTRALESSETTFGIALVNGERVAQMAIETRSNLEEVSKLYIRTAAAAAKLGIDTAVAVDVTTTFAKALKLGQASTAEQTSAISQFSQALQKGTLNGDEFRTIMESAGVVQQALIEKFKVSGATLIKMAEDGKIGARDMIAALQQVKPQIDEAFGKSAATVSEAWENLRTSITVTLGKYNEAEGVTRGLADGMQALANSMETIAKLFAVMGAAAFVAFGPGIAISIGAWAAGLAGAAAGMGTFVGAMVALTVAIHAVDRFGDAWVVAADKGTTARDVMEAMYHFAREGLSAAAETATTAFLKFADAALDALLASQKFSASGEKSARDFSGAMRDAVNFVIGAFDGMAKIIAASALTVFGAIPREIISLLNVGLLHLEDFVRGAAGILNNLPGVSINVDAMQLYRIPNIFAGATATVEALWASAAKSMGRDYIAEMGGAVDTVMDRAGRVSAWRRWEKGTTVERAIDPKPVHPDPLAKKYTDAIEKLKDHTAAVLDEAKAVGKGAAEKERAAAMHDLLVAAKKAEIAVTPALLADMDELARAYGAARGQLEFLQAMQRAKEDNTEARQQIQTIGLYGYELFRARKEMELLNDAKRAGVVLDAATRADIARTAAATAATQQLNDSLAAVRDTSRAALSGFISDLREGKSGAEALSGSLNKIADKLLDMAANQLVEAALGGLFGNKSAGGAGLLSLFGFADGGVMTHGGPRALNRFAGGGVSTSAAIFGEAGPEAAVPLPDGRRIPVELRVPNISAASRQVSASQAGPAIAVTVAPVFHVGGKVSADDLAALEVRVAKSLPAVARGAVAQALERQPGFGRKGV